MRIYAITHGFGINGTYYGPGNAQDLDQFSMEELQPSIDAGHLTVREEHEDVAVQYEVVETQPDTEE